MIEIRRNLMKAIIKAHENNYGKGTMESLLVYYCYNDNYISMSTTRCTDVNRNCRYFVKDENKLNKHWRKDDYSECAYCVGDDCYNPFVWVYFALDYLRHLYEINDFTLMGRKESYE